MAAKTKQTKNKEKTSPAIAKSKDGTIQITLKIPFKDIKAARETAAREIGKNLEIAGFRKGKAPLSKLLTNIPENTLIEQTLRFILPKLTAKVVKENNLKIAIYPRFELISAEENKDWQVRAITCEIPRVELGDYKKIVKKSARGNELWTPDKKEEKKEPSKEDKEQRAITALLENIKIDIPKPLIDSETEKRLAQLLERIEKLGLTLESYLASIGKKIEDLRLDYEKQAMETIKLDLILFKIAEEEKIKVSEEEINKAMQAFVAGGESPKALEERKLIIESILKKRAALDALVSLL
jgi:FKBP-type peptidyl-prolyl cis-trans isomerase (trigger factor)